MIQVSTIRINMFTGKPAIVLSAIAVEMDIEHYWGNGDGNMIMTDLLLSRVINLKVLHESVHDNEWFEFIDNLKGHWTSITSYPKKVAWEFWILYY